MIEPPVKQSHQLPQTPRPIVLIGAGGIVRDAHLPAYHKAGFTVVGVYDRDSAKAQSLAQDFAIPRVYGSLEEAATAKPPEAVFDIAVPASALPPILQALPPQSDVLMQKPMGENLAEAKEILAICRTRDLTAAVNFQMRYAPYIIAARDLIERGLIGQVHDMEVRVTVETPWHLWSFLEGIPRLEILYHSIHYLDLMRSFLGEPRGLYAKTVRYPGLDRLAGTRTGMLLDYGDFQRATITTNHHHRWGIEHQESYVKWEGTQGAIKARLGLLMDYPRGAQDRLEYIVPSDGEPATWTTLPITGSWFPDAFIGTMSSLQCYAEGSSPVLPTSVEDAYRTMALVEAAYQSSASGATAIPD